MFLRLEETERCTGVGWHCPPATAAAPCAQGGDTAWSWASCSKGAPAPPKLGGASAPLAAFHCLGKVLSPALVSLACVPLAALWAQGAFIPFFPCFYITTSSQRQQDSQTFPDKGVSTLAVLQQWAQPTSTSVLQSCTSSGQELRHIRDEKNFCTCLSKRELKVIFLHIFLQCSVVCISQVRIGYKVERLNRRETFEAKRFSGVPVLPPDFDHSLVISRQSLLRIKGKEKNICPQLVTVRVTLIFF